MKPGNLEGGPIRKYWGRSHQYSLTYPPQNSQVSFPNPWPVSYPGFLHRATQYMITLLIFCEIYHIDLYLHAQNSHNQTPDFRYFRTLPRPAPSHHLHVSGLKLVIDASSSSSRGRASAAAYRLSAVFVFAARRSDSSAHKALPNLRDALPFKSQKKKTTTKRRQAQKATQNDTNQRNRITGGNQGQRK